MTEQRPNSTIENYTLTCQSWDQCTPEERQDFLAFVRAGGEVEPHGLEDRAKLAVSLIFLRKNGCLAGVAALKKPDRNYWEGVFKKARAELTDVNCPLELGWIFVLPSFRNQGCSGRLVEAALRYASTSGVYPQ